MKTKRNILLFFNIIAFFSFISFNDVQGQTLVEENNKVLERMDKESFKGKIVLNKAIALDHHLVPFRTREKDKDGGYSINIEPGLMNDLIEMAERGEMDGQKKPEAINKIQKRTRNEITASNIVPVAIINLDAILLTEKQVEENIKTKEDGKIADASQYETVELIAAGLLQYEIFQEGYAIDKIRLPGS